jgi:hypothetical protein
LINPEYWLVLVKFQAMDALILDPKHAAILRAVYVFEEQKHKYD